MGFWFLLQTRPRQELRAVEHLANQDLNVYCPSYFRKNKGKEILFPSYIFIQSNTEMQLKLGKIRSTRGVSHFVKFGGRPAVLSDELIETIKQQESYIEDSPIFTKGQSVAFSGGPFAEYQAIYLYDRGEDRAIVLLQLLSASREVQVKNTWLRSV